MKYNVGRRMADHFAGDGGTGFQRQRSQPARPPSAGQYAAVNDMQRIQFQTCHLFRHDFVEGVEARCRVFAVQTDNKVSAYFQPMLLRQGDGALVTGIIMVAVNAPPGFILCALMPQLQPDFIAPSR